MQLLLADIRGALAANLHILAVHGAMSIPDMCSALENPDSKAGERYAAWFDRYLGKTYAHHSTGQPILTGQQFWWLRCKMLHQGAVHDPRMGNTRVAFTPTTHLSVGENNDGSPGRVVLLVPQRLVLELLSAADDWMAATANDVDVQRRTAELMQFYPKGMGGQVFGPMLG